VKSSQTNINDMLLEHKSAVFQRLRDEAAGWGSENAKVVNGDAHTPIKAAIEPEMDGVDPATPQLEISSPETAGREPRLTTPVKDGSIKEENATSRGLSGSPNPSKFESPSRMPPVGVFSVTTPERMLRDA
jgi:hypothetical protein